ncbi:MAG: AsmA-like C-terminal domain-containing protein, partial [Pseudomonadota bacterium]|nr:AsmA-like C-terminal domain-containing protein [Pseudomonadota bacterium]
ELLTISRGALQGNALGGTVSGSVDLSQQTLNLTGTFVPIYALNNFFAKIPLLGFALGGNSGEGLIGVTYRLSGSVSDPVLSVNPISAIAPGIFRKMFEFQAN